MATINELYPVPYNTLSSTAYNNYTIIPNEAIKFDDLFKQAKEAYSKYGFIPKDIATQVYGYYKTGTIDYLAAVKSFISLAGLIPEVAPFVPFANQFVSFIWPKLFGGSSNNPPDIFEQLKPQIQALVDEAIYKQNEQLLADTASGFQGVINLYYEKVEDYKKDPTDTNNLTSLRGQVDIVRNFFVHDAPHFMNSGMVAMPYLVNMTNLQLMVLRDAIQAGTRWGYSDNTIATLLTAFRNITRDYSKWVYDTFTKELNDKYSNYANMNDWNKRNDFITIATLTGLDFVALWPTLDPKMYPTESDIDFTRTLTSKITWSGVPSKAWATNLPSFDNARYKGRLSKIELAIFTDNNGMTAFFNGIRETIHTVNGDITYSDYRMSNLNWNNINIDSNNPIVKTSLTNVISGKVQSADFTVTLSDGTSKSMGTYAPIWASSPSYGEELSAPANHKVDLVFSTFNSADPFYSYVNVYTPMKLVPENIIGDDVQINGFPFEKASYGGTVVKEWLNGANAMKLSPGQSIGIPITNVTKQNYQVRCRYASNSDNPVFFNVDTGGANPIFQQINFESTVDSNMGVKGENGVYVVKSTPTVDNPITVEIPAKTINVHLTNQGSSDIFLDRIEFVPIPPSPISIDGQFSDTAPLIFYSSDDAYNHIKLSGSYTSYDHFSKNLTFHLFHPTDSTKDHYIHVRYSPFDFEYGENSVPGGLLFNKIIVEGANNGSFNGNVTGTISVEGASREANTQFQLPSDIQNITTQVNALFASNTQDALATNVSDHDIEEVVLKVDALSDEVFGKEKKTLRKLVNQAKRLSKARNLLVGGNFDNLDAWYRGRNVVNVSNHELLKSDHVLLPPPTLYPSYIFQKVEESKLKANTRYTVSGFIAHAEDLEIVVSRYGQEVKKVVQVPYGEAFPLTSSGAICCPPRSTSNGKPADPHFFSYSIDVGTLDVEANPGIELGLRIVERTGMARVSNLEIREDRPLTTNELRNVQRAARNWRTAYDQERAEVTALIQPVLNQINALYENEDWNGAIRSGVSYHDLEAIVLPTLPKLNHWFMSDMLGEQGSILAQFQEALDRAYTQLEGSTLLHNGHFTTDAANWTIEGDAHHAILEDGRRILRLPDWSSSVSQTIEIENFDSDKEYQLVFHAQGEGTVSLQHGEEGEYVETHPHKFANFTTSHRQGVTFETNKVTVEIASEDGEFLVDHIALVEAPLPTDDQSSDGNTTSNTNSNTSMNNNQ
ncbi:insecticidal delta-endotoxin Cry8Ea1 family protein [Bacillus thuringiensis]|uniref:insecticidal delta-endotoxin Cry8Ea1 family protein n=1 Tax=Bacillus thuringiensis TaxID=1428 RepID=UPI001F54B901|nr:insecticidal delta-endotoxin Cry8Ea1 family protein [Bacillus thuringiensis]